MNLSELYSRHDWISLPVASGWLVAKNELYDKALEPLDTLYSATNLKSGRSVELGFDEMSGIFHVVLSAHPRNEVGWNVAAIEEEKLIYKGPEQKRFVASLSSVLSKSEISLLPLKIPAWWYVRRNTLSKSRTSDNSKNSPELIFEAFSLYSRPYYISLSTSGPSAENYLLKFAATNDKPPSDHIDNFRLSSLIWERALSVGKTEEARQCIERFLADPEYLEKNTEPR